MTPDIRAAIASWPKVAPFLVPPASRQDYANLVRALDAVLDAGGADEASPLANLAAILGDLVAGYEASRRPLREIGATQFLRLLMKERGLRQIDLPEIGPQSVVSDVLRGKRALNVRQIARLSKRFGIPAAALMP